jgi:curli biogenesis system outer membrane secretion channel CsgG
MSAFFSAERSPFCDAETSTFEPGQEITMSRTLVSRGILITLLLLPAVPAATQPRGNLRYSVMVSKFDNATGDERALGEEWATLLTSKLQTTGHFIVVAQGDMQENAIQEQVRGTAGVTTQGRKTAQRSQMTPAQLLVKGVITQLKKDSADQSGGVNVGPYTVGGGRTKTEIRATLQMIDASTGALVAANNFVGTSQKKRIVIGRREGVVQMGQDDNVHAALENAIDTVIPWMVQQLPSVQWRGTVIKVDKERVIVNRGSREGVSSGDEFIVGESEILRDPDTGEVLDEIVKERARVKVVQVGDKTAVCSVVSGNIGQIVERMTVRYGNGS